MEEQPAVRLHQADILPPLRIQHPGATASREQWARAQRGDRTPLGHAPDQADARLLLDNLHAIFCEPSADRRIEAIARIWVRHPVMYDVSHAFAGSAAVMKAAERFQRLLQGADCVRTEPVLGHNGLCMLRWHGERSGVPIGVAGCHLAFISRGRIDTMYVLEERA